MTCLGRYLGRVSIDEACNGRVIGIADDEAGGTTLLCSFSERLCDEVVSHFPAHGSQADEADGGRTRWRFCGLAQEVK